MEIKLLDGYKCKFTNKNTKIYDSYILTEQEILSLSVKIYSYRIRNNFKVTRSINSYIKEIKAHNRLYKLGLFKNHVTDTDLEEPIKWWKEIIYKIIGW